MNSLRGLLILFLALAACGAPEPDPGYLPPADVRVVTDGRFDEWGRAAVLLADPEDAEAGSAVDLGEIRAADDPRWLHLAVDVRRLVNAQRMRGTLRILFDADGDPSTGAEVLAMPGVDVIAELSRRDRDPLSPYGAGNGLRPVTSGGPGAILPGYVAGLLSAPTFSASRFEIRLERGVGIEGLPALFTEERVRVKAVFEGSDGFRDETDVASYRLSHPFAKAEPSIFEPSIAKTGDVVRVVHWNVAGEAFRDRPEPFLRILGALEPDVVLFDEVYGSVTREELESFFGSLGEWHVVLGTSGGRQKNVVASCLPLRPAEALLDVPYPPGGLEGLAEGAGDPEFLELLEAERGRGLATAGAWVDLGEGREVLFVPLDFQSGGYDGSPRDRLREVQATALRERIASVLEEEGASAVVVAGDFNLVGSKRPLDLLRRGLDQGGADLTVSEAYRLTDRSQSTWRDTEAGDYTPGRLDFLLYSASSLEAVRSFVFDAEELSDSYLGRLGLMRDDSRAASRHLPVVGDFR